MKKELLKLVVDLVLIALAFACGFAFNGWLNAMSVDAAPASPIKVVAEFTSEDVGSVYLLTDNVTGCQYIREYTGGITPRMYSDGIQVCGQSTYPNGEHGHE